MFGEHWCASWCWCSSTRHDPSFEGLPSKILCANVLRTLRSHWSYALQLHSSNNARVSPHSSIKYSIRAWPTCRYKWAKQASELKQRFYSCIASSAARDGDMLSVRERNFPAPYADNHATALKPLLPETESHLILRASNLKTRFSSWSSNFYNFTPRIHQKRSQKVRNPKFSWGACPQTPPIRRPMRALIAYWNPPFQNSRSATGISFQKAYKSAFLVRFVVSVMLHIHPGRVSWLHGFGTEMPGI